MPRVLRLCRALVLLTVQGTLPGAPEDARVSVLAVPEAGAVPDAEVAGDGTVHVVWVAGENVLYAQSHDGGKTLSAPRRVNSEADSSHPANTHRGPEIGLDAQGTAHVIWFQNGYQRKLPPDQWGVAYARLKAGAKVVEPSRNLSRRPSEGFSLAVAPSGAELRWQLFGPSGRPLGPAHSRPSRDALRHAAVGLPDGRFLLVN